MARFYSAAVSSIIILVCYSAANLSQPQRVNSPVRQFSSEQSASNSYSGYLPRIEELPWNAFAESGETLCSAMIIHEDWVLVLHSCALNVANGSDIIVSAGGATPAKATQVFNAKIHQTTDQLEGFTLLHLNGSLAFDKKVQAARIPRSPIGNINYFDGFASGFVNESNAVQLEAFYATVFTSLCSDSENLCAFGTDWPPTDVRLAGVDFLGVPYLYADGSHQCMLGGRKSYIGDNFTSYSPLLNILPIIQKDLGLTIKPIPPADPTVVQAWCGILQ